MTADEGNWAWPSGGGNEEPDRGEPVYGPYGQGGYGPYGQGGYGPGPPPHQQGPWYGPYGYGPGPPPYQQGSWYGRPPPGWRRPSYAGEAVAAFVLAILSFLIVPVVPAIIALVLAHLARGKIWASGGALRGFGLCRAATILAVVNLVVAVFGIAIASGHI
ncbi:MAG: hypothetical protein J2P57_06955 [Acidimicrobiaceae bacterium]|nr:hypothetical protein [Acidimicrobiaceae bacterium]